MSDRCPICAGPIVGHELKWMPAAAIMVYGDQAMRFGAQETVVFNVLWNARKTGEPVKVEWLIEIIWGGQSSGGPDDAYNRIHNVLWRIRQKITGTSIAILSDYDGGHYIAAREG